jgi:hypothetical protein
MLGIKDWGLEKVGRRTAEGGERPTAHRPLPALDSRLSTLSSQLSTRRSRRGITLLEVLVSIGILSVGLFGVAALVPLGAMLLRDAVASDRTGALGRAAIRDVKVRGMLCSGTPTAPNWWTATPPIPKFPPSPPVTPVWPSTWQAMQYPDLKPGDINPGGTPPTIPPLPVAFAIDPLGVGAAFEKAIPAGDQLNPARMGVAKGVTSGGLDRITLASLAVMRDTTVSPNPERVAADVAFRWHDDLLYTRAKDYKGTPPNGDRPSMDIPPNSRGEFSWFLTVKPSLAEANLPVAQATPTLPGGQVTLPPAFRRQFQVSVVVCDQRDFTMRGAGNPTPTPASTWGEQTVAVTFLSPIQYGGGSISLPGQVSLKDNQWIMLLYTPSTGPSSGTLAEAIWYRIVNSGFDPTSNTTNISLVGSDWNASTTGVMALIIPGVTGVYTTTMQLDN